MTKKKSCIIYSVIGFLFVFCCMTEYELAAEGNIIWNGMWIGKLLVSCLVAGTLLGCGICLGLLKLEQLCSADRGQGNDGKLQKKTLKLPRAGILFWISLACILLCWLPGYLAYYPGVCAYDFTIQMGQVSGGTYNEHHPLCHTLLMEFFIRLGDALGNGTFGLAMYVFVQMSLLAAVLAGGIALLRKRGAAAKWLICLQVFCCIFPFHWYMSISATKDTLFTTFVLLQMLMFCGLLDKREDRQTFGLWDAGFLLGSIGMILFRNNGRYAMAVMAGFLLLAVIFGKRERPLWIKLLIETAAGILIGSLLLSAVFSLTKAQQSDRREMLSMPIQQLARTMIYHGGVGVLEEDDDTMDEADKALINEYILNEAYKKYRPDISDPVKGNTKTSVILAKPKEFISTYVGLFLQYPGDYLNAVLAVNAGFLSPFDETHAYINVNGRDTGLGYIQTRWIDLEPNPYEIHRDSKWPWLREKLEAFADANMYLKIPVLKYLLVPGAYLWLYLILAAWLLIHKKYRQLLPFTLILGYYATLILGPTVQMRYIYPVMVLLPYVSIWLLSSVKKNSSF